MIWKNGVTLTFTKQHAVVILNSPLEGSHWLYLMHPDGPHSSVTQERESAVRSVNKLFGVLLLWWQRGIVLDPPPSIPYFFLSGNSVRGSPTVWGWAAVWPHGWGLGEGKLPLIWLSQIVHAVRNCIHRRMWRGSAYRAMITTDLLGLPSFPLWENEATVKCEKRGRRQNRQRLHLANIQQ